MLHRMVVFCAGLALGAGSLAAEETLAAGTYKGQWSGAGAAGDIQLTFHAKSAGGLTPEVASTEIFNVSMRARMRR